ncbi:hypothetical protein ACLBYF_34300, partial [Methylobacterium brachiatum]
KRKRWARQPGNDGKVRIGVPVDVLDNQTDTGSTPGTEPPDAPAQVPDTDPVQPVVPVPDVTTVLTRHIERLEAQLEVALTRASDRDSVATTRDVL